MVDAARKLGKRFGYPACCIEQYAQDIAALRYPAVLRGSVHPHHTPSGRPASLGSYVPCSACIPKAQAAGTWRGWRK